jgi:hypothetical protein
VSKRVIVVAPRGGRLLERSNDWEITKNLIVVMTREDGEINKKP